MNDEEAPTLRSIEVQDTIPAPRHGAWFSTVSVVCWWCGANYQEAFALSTTTIEERAELKARCLEMHEPGCIYIPVINIIAAGKP